MPHSPYVKQVYPPISDGDLATVRGDLHRIRWKHNDGIDDIYAVDMALNNGELLLEQCEFLEAKLTIKKRENFQLTTQNEALAKKVATLEMESGVMKDEKRVRKEEELAMLKAKHDMEIEFLDKENKAYEKELAALGAMLKDKPESSTNQSSITEDQARPGDKAGVGTDKSPAEAAEAGPGKDEGLLEPPPQLAAAALPSSPLKRRGLESDLTIDQKPPKMGRRMVASLK